MRAFLAVVLLWGCGGRWQGPVVVIPFEDVVVPREAYVAVTAEVPSGGSPGPIRLTEFTVECVDRSVCVTELVQGRLGAEARVAPLKAGSSEVLVKFVHPKRGDPGEQRFRVTFRDRLSKTLEPGSLVRDWWEDLNLLKSGTETLSCYIGGNDLGWAWESIRQDAVDQLSCRRPAAVSSAPPAFYFFPANRNPATDDDGLEICLVKENDRVKSLTIVQRNGRRVSLIEQRGPIDARYCQFSTRDNDT